ncbi:hypothetical protein MTO96_002672 [Rhipicephalus appendiculatus]
MAETDENSPLAGEPRTSLVNEGGCNAASSNRHEQHSSSAANSQAMTEVCLTPHSDAPQGCDHGQFWPEIR